MALRNSDQPHIEQALTSKRWVCLLVNVVKCAVHDELDILTEGEPRERPGILRGELKIFR